MKTSLIISLANILLTLSDYLRLRAINLEKRMSGFTYDGKRYSK